MNYTEREHIKNDRAIDPERAMKQKSRTLHSILLATAFATTSLAAAPRNDADASRIAVTWTNPTDFSDARTSPGSAIGRERPDEWLDQLARHLRTRADRALPTGQHLDVTFTDIQRAGVYEPWRGPQWDDVRIIKDIYPPKIDLKFTLTDSSGNVVRDGARTLRDPAFLQRGILNETDPLRFEKRMLDDWMRKEFATPD